MPDDAVSDVLVNPLATPGQRELENVALRLLERPELKRARTIADMLWRNATQYPARDQLPRLDAMIDEYLFHFALRAANSDANYPQVLRFMAPPHRWFGRDVPGSRWAGDSPDFIYRVIPIAHGARYELRGQPSCREPPTVNYALIADAPAPVNLGLVDSLDIRAEANGEFLITIDATPADGRTNHLQTKPGADHVLIRDALGDWNTQSPNALQIRRLDGPDRDPLSDEALARRAARTTLEGIYYAYYTTQSGSSHPPNELRAPQSSAASGGMATQWGSKANVVLEDDEVLIVTVNGAGALFRNAVLCDLFYLSVDHWSRTGSLNMRQMAPDADDRFTCVVAHQDPGIHNWLDTGGLRRTVFGHRWQAFQRGGATETPTIASRTVRFSELGSALPPGVQRIDAAARREQLAQRQAGFKRRFIWEPER